MLFHFIARRLKIFRFICNGLLSCSIRPAFWQSLPSLGSGQADHAREEYPQGNEIDTLHNYFEAWLDKLSESYTLLTHSYQLMPYCCLYFPLLGTAYYSLLSFILSIARVVPRAHSLLNPIKTSYIES